MVDISKAYVSNCVLCKGDLEWEDDDMCAKCCKEHEARKAALWEKVWSDLTPQRGS